MLSLSHTTAVLFFAGALVAGFLVSWVHFKVRTGARFVALPRHRQILAALRSRYRRRLRAVRDAMLRHRLAEEQLREELRSALARGVEDAKLLDGTVAQSETLRVQVAELECALAESESALSQLRERERSLDGQLDGALEKVGAFEHERALLRIEREELMARTQRLKALPATAGEAPADTLAEASDEPAAGGDNAGWRAELADRDARIHELDCALRESAGRVAELEANLHRWKYRIAPLALHLKMKRERARQAGDGDQAVAAAKGPERGDDDLRRIRGIGRALEKKLRAAGVRRYSQLATMSPAELANLAVRVGVAASRPVRDRWAEQARECDGTADPLTEAPAVAGQAQQG